MIKLKGLIKEETKHACECGGDCCKTAVNESLQLPNGKKIQMGRIFTGQGKAFMKEEDLDEETTDEGFGSEDTLDKKGIKEFEQWRKDNAEQLGYKLVGTSDIKESVNEAYKKIGKKVIKYKDKTGSWNWDIESGIDTDVLDGKTPKIMINYQHKDEKGFPKSGGNFFWLKEKDGTPYTPQKAKAFLNKIAKKNTIEKFLDSIKPSGTGNLVVYKGGKFVRESVNEALPNRVWMDLRKKYSTNELKRFFKKESVNERKNPKREKAKKNFSKYLKSMEKEIRGIKSFAKANQWGAISSFVDDGLVKDMKLLQKEIDTIIELPIDESVNEAIEQETNIPFEMIGKSYISIKGRKLTAKLQFKGNDLQDVVNGKKKKGKVVLASITTK